jgi:orotate phosphoribosyltransferase
MGADPVAYAIAAASLGSKHPMDAFSVRKQVKEHGTGRSIEGNFRPGDQVIIVEDVITTGDSAQRASRAVQDAGGRVVGILAVVDRQEGGRQSLEAAGHQIIALTTIADLGLDGNA